MVIFQDIQEVEEWLKPISYAQLWDALEPYAVFTLADRDHCDGLIERGEVRQDTILEVLKGMARNAIRSNFNLDFRRYETLARQSTKSLH
ncbi:MAG: hypothetical protein AAF092_10030 [Pseudomonadota bacterium]